MQMQMGTATVPLRVWERASVSVNDREQLAVRSPGAMNQEINRSTCFARNTGNSPGWIVSPQQSVTGFSASLRFEWLAT